MEGINRLASGGIATAAFLRPASPRATWTEHAQPVFLIGAPRSGTTWLQALLASHPHIYSGPETHFFHLFATAEKEFLKLNDRLGAGLCDYASRDTFYRCLGELFWRFMSELPEPDEAPALFLEKTPRHCLYGPMIRRTFPQAKFIHLIRDGRAVAASLLRASQSWAKQWAPRTADAAAKRWVSHTRAGLEIGRESPPGQYLELRYEDLRRRPHDELRRLFDWLGLESDDQMLSAALAQHDLEKVRSSERGFASIVTRPGRELKHGAFRGFIGPAPVNADETDLTPRRRRRIEHLAGKLLLELGYLQPGEGPSGWQKAGGWLYACSDAVRTARVWRRLGRRRAA